MSGLFNTIFNHAIQVDKLNYQLLVKNLKLIANEKFALHFFDSIESHIELFEFTKKISSSCLCTSFLWAQHLGCIRQIKNSENYFFIKKYLNKLLNGELFGGVSFAGLPVGNFSLKYETYSDYYIFKGKNEYLTGIDIFDLFVIWSSNPSFNKSAAFFVKASELDVLNKNRLDLISANASNTYSLAWEGFKLSKSQKLYEIPIPRFNQPLGTILNAAAFELGVLSRISILFSDSILINNSKNKINNLSNELIKNYKKENKNSMLAVRNKITKFVQEILNYILIKYRKNVINNDDYLNLFFRDLIFSAAVSNTKETLSKFY